jgi:hypothetical protein
MAAGASGVTVFWAVTAAGIEANAIPKIKIRRTKSFMSLMMHENSREWVHRHHGSVRKM